MQHHDENPTRLDELIEMREVQRVIGEHILAMLADFPRNKRRFRAGRVTQQMFGFTLATLLRARLTKATNGTAASRALDAAVCRFFVERNSSNGDLDDDIPF
jgi:hypothetical protein